MIWVLALLFFIVLICFAVLLRRQRHSRRLAERRLKDLNDELKKVLRRFEEERARLESTFSGMVEGVLLTDQRGDILHLNPAFREMFGLKNKAEGKSALEVLASVPCDNAIREVIEKEKPVEREIIFEKPGRRIFQVNFSPIRREGKLFGVVSIFHDLTEIRRLETVRRDFLANLSHELKTPLTAICGFSETLLEDHDAKPEDSRKHLEIIFRHAAELGHLMENLLNLSRIESGKEELFLEPVNLRILADRLFERFSAQAKLKEITLHNEVPEDFPPFQADPAKLTQILSNLLDNALKYSLERGRVAVRAQKAKDGLTLEVEDEGPGIPPAAQERIFERFYRLDPARSRDTGGAGLGLSIVKHLVELHGGQVNVESQWGQGSKFKIYFPTSSVPQ